METNYQLNYYDYGINLEIQGVTPVIGGGVNPEPGPEPEPEPDTHEYVDFGLPSGILWAKENIKDENGNDLYFAWGETQGYTAEQVGTDKNFSWEDYKYGTYDGSDTENYGMTKYNKTDGKTVLDPEDDAAVVNWGNGWRMPTVDEYTELSNLTVLGDKTEGVWFSGEEEEDVIGIPFCGYAKDGAVVVVEDSEYMIIDFNWLSSIGYRNITQGQTPMITIDNYSPTEYSDVINSLRCCGRTVRPVRQK